MIRRDFLKSCIGFLLVLLGCRRSVDWQDKADLQAGLGGVVFMPNAADAPTHISMDALASLRKPDVIEIVGYEAVTALDILKSKYTVTTVTYSQHQPYPQFVSHIDGNPGNVTFYINGRFATQGIAQPFRGQSLVVLFNGQVILWFEVAY